MIIVFVGSFAWDSKILFCWQNSPKDFFAILKTYFFPDLSFTFCDFCKFCLDFSKNIGEVRSHSLLSLDLPSHHHWLIDFRAPTQKKSPLLHRNTFISLLRFYSSEDLATVSPPSSATPKLSSSVSHHVLEACVSLCIVSCEFSRFISSFFIAAQSSCSLDLNSDGMVLSLQ